MASDKTHEIQVSSSVRHFLLIIGFSYPRSDWIPTKILFLALAMETSRWETYCFMRHTSTSKNITVILTITVLL